MSDHQEAETPGIVGAIAEIEKRNGVVKHTPGPWRVSPYNRTDVIAKSRGDASIADCAQPVLENQSETIANARLIAAAPELFEALRTLYGNLDEYQRINNLGGYNNQDMQAARAAIAKAEGQL